MTRANRGFANPGAGQEKTRGLSEAELGVERRSFAPVVV